MAENNDKDSYLVGVDFGGAKILGGIFDSSLRLVGSAKTSTKAQRGPDAVIERIVQCVRDTIDEADLSIKDVRGVGIGVPGTVDRATGSIIFAPNLDWREVPLQKQLEKLCGLPVFVENDGNLATLGVYGVELQSKPRDMFRSR
jgi:glucokinase